VGGKGGKRGSEVLKRKEKGESLPLRKRSNEPHPVEGREEGDLERHYQRKKGYNGGNWGGERRLLTDLVKVKRRV